MNHDSELEFEFPVDMIRFSAQCGRKMLSEMFGMIGELSETEILEVKNHYSKNGKTLIDTVQGFEDFTETEKLCFSVHFFEMIDMMEDVEDD